MREPLETGDADLYFWLSMSTAAGLAVALFAAYKLPFYSASVMLTKWGVFLSAGSAVALTSSCAVVLRLRHRRSARDLVVGLAASLLSVALMATALELVLRALVREAPEGRLIGATRIRPTWEELRSASRAAIDKANPSGPWRNSYFVYDGQLGWTVGRNRAVGNGLYFSSSEGIRSARRGVSFAAQVSNFSVAMVGDSHTFSLGVPFEETWGHYLAERLGADVRVLNFGVDGYSLEQMLLRYRRDVRTWQPNVVMVSFIQHDIQRSWAVYPMVTMGWPGYLVKPKMRLVGGTPEVVNYPLPTPQEILSAASVSELPHIDLDRGYATQEWQWRFPKGPLLLRFITSLSPRYPATGERYDTDSLVELNAAVLRTIHAEILASGSKPLIIYLPDGHPRVLGRSVIAKSRVPHVDEQECLSSIPLAERKLPDGSHETGRANRALAECTFPHVAKLLDERRRERADRSASADAPSWRRQNEQPM